MPIKVNSKYEWGQIFYVKSDSDQKEHLLIQIIVTPNGIQYGLTCDGEYDEFYFEEISETKKM